ncbi:MAG TPA: penicillin acylase family protein, partial [Vicinamibacterales bacterium]
APVGAFRSVRLEQDAAGPLPAPAGIVSADPWRVSADGRGTLTASEAPRALEVPARRYIVHLHAPGWNVIGLASPWLPGVITGHNERIAWGSVPTDADTQDVFVVRADAGAIERVVDTIRVKGRPAAQAFERNTTRSGVVVATDRDHDSVITVRWSGSEPGTAAELAAMTIDRAETPEQMRAALARWKLPARRFVFADVDGRVEFHDAALIPRRVGGNWSGWLPFADLAHGSPPKIDAHGPQSPSTAHADRATFAHMLGITPAARARFNVGPFAPPSDGASPIRVVFDTRDWDRSQGMVAPGEGEFADGPHYADLGRAWSKGELVPLVFSDEAVRRNAAETLSLVPAIR